jgi:hypothetical protein
MCCSAVSARRGGGNWGAGAAGNARMASRDKLRFSGLEAADATAARGAAVAALDGCGLGDAGPVCRFGLIAAGAGSAASGGVAAWDREGQVRAGPSRRLPSGWGDVLIWACKGGSSTSTVGAKRCKLTCGLGAGICTPCNTKRKPKCSKSTSATLSNRKRLKVFKCAPCLHHVKPQCGSIPQDRKNALACP